MELRSRQFRSGVSFQVYGEINTTDSIQSGVALANPSASPVTVSVQAVGLNGTPQSPVPIWSFVSGVRRDQHNRLHPVRCCSGKSLRKSSHSKCTGCRPEWNSAVASSDLEFRFRCTERSTQPTPSSPVLLWQIPPQVQSQ